MLKFIMLIGLMGAGGVVWAQETPAVETSGPDVRLTLGGIRYENLSRVSASARNQHTVSGAVLAALRLHRAAEVFGRVEQYDDNTNRNGQGDTYLTGGFSFSPSRLRGRPYSRQRLTLGYSVLLPQHDGDPTRHLVILQAQIAF